MRLLIVCAFLALAAPAGAQQTASAGQDYALSVQYLQRELNKRDAEAKANNAVAASEKTALRKQIAALEAAVAQLAKAQDPSSKSALSAFAQGDGEKGLDALEAGAKAKAASAVEDWRRIGAIAFAVDTRRAVNAYEQVLKFAPNDLDARTELGSLKYRLGDLAGAEAALRVVLASPDQSWQMIALGNLGVIATTRGDIAAADNYLKQSLALAIVRGDRQVQANALGNLGANALEIGDLAAAEEYAKEALALHTATGDKSGQADALSNLGLILQQNKDLPGAEIYLGRALALSRELGDKEGEGTALNNLGNIAYARGEYAKAEDYYTRGLAIDDALGHKEGQAIRLANLGVSAVQRGDLAGAEAYLRRALALNTELGSTQGQAADLDLIGSIYATRKDYIGAIPYFDRAAELWPTKADYQNRRCWNRALINRELDVARVACDEAVRLAPQDSAALDSRGLVNLRQRRYQDAWNDYNAATKISASRASYLYGRGIAALKLKRTAEGKADIANAKLLDPKIADTYAGFGIKP